MKQELFCDYIVFENGRVITPEGTEAPRTTQTPETMVNIKGEWYSLANLLALLFLPYKEGCDHVHFKDGDMTNWHLDNLELAPRPIDNKIKLTKEQRLQYMRHITNQDLPENEIKFMVDLMNGGYLQGERAPIQYEPLDLVGNKVQQFAPVVEVLDVNTGCHIMTGSSKEIHERLGVNVYDTYKGYSQGRITKQGYLMLPLALVPKQYINATVRVTSEDFGDIAEGSYSEICQLMNLHYESLTDILNYGTDEPVHYYGNTFEIIKKEGK